MIAGNDKLQVRVQIRERDLKSVKTGQRVRVTGAAFDKPCYDGTVTSAVFNKNSIDFTPLGDIDSTIVTLVTMNTHIDFAYTLKVDKSQFTLSTLQLKEILGDVPLDLPDVVMWIKDYLKEQTQIIRGGAV